MNSQILQGETWHCRHQPQRHFFSYRMFWLCLDLDELEMLDRSVSCFGYDRRALVLINAADYAGNGRGSIRGKFLRLLEQNDVSEPIARISLITLPKVFGYVFNPISVYRCYRPDGTLAVMVAEVRNTFGEAHHYILRPENRSTDDGKTIRFRTPKAFYVSPFLEVAGEYELFLTEEQDAMLLHVNLRQRGELVFSAAMGGRGVPLTSKNLASALCRLPLLAATVMLRIHWQALQLHVRKRLSIFARSNPVSPATIVPDRPGFWHRIRSRIVLRVSQNRSQSRAGPNLIMLKGRQ